MALTRIDSYLVDLDSLGGITFDDQAGTPTFKVDAVNHRVGIGTTNPLEKLDVRGNIFLPSSSYISKQFTDGVEDLILRGYGGAGWVPWISYTPSSGTANREKL